MKDIYITVADEKNGEKTTDVIDVSQYIQNCDIDKNKTKNYKSAAGLVGHKFKIIPNKPLTKNFLNANNPPFCVYDPGMDDANSKNSCGITALSICMGWSFDEVKKQIMLTKNIDKWDESGVATNDILRLMPSDFNYKEAGDGGVMINCKRVGLAEIAKEIALGIVIIKTPTNYHAVACVDGVIYDNNYIFAAAVFGNYYAEYAIFPNLSKDAMEARTFAVNSFIDEMRRMDKNQSMSHVFKLKNKILEIDKTMQM